MGNFFIWAGGRSRSFEARQPTWGVNPFGRIAPFVVWVAVGFVPARFFLAKVKFLGKECDAMCDKDGGALRDMRVFREIRV